MPANRPPDTNRPDNASDKPNEKTSSRKPDDPNATSAANDPSQVEGEGSYTAARRHRESVEDYLESHDVQQDARDAAPEDAKQAQEMAEAEKKGKKHARH